VVEDITPFRSAVSDADLDDLRERLRRTRWPEASTVDDWSQGVPLGYLQNFCAHWSEAYDWRALETRLDQRPQFRTEIDGLGIHFLHVRSPEPTALPLLLSHGWPGSFVEFLDVVGPLTDPASYGGNAADAFHLVIPSLPGYGFSDRPAATGWGIERIADAWATLMARLGYQSYGAQGGDWGAAITTCLAQQHPDPLVGIHLNLIRARPPKGQTEFSDVEQACIATGLHYQEWESGYSQQQATRPQTLGYGLTDSPAGQAAWIAEKFWAWTDNNGHPEDAVSRQQILDEISVYWFTASATSSARLYWESFGSFRNKITAPSGLSVYPRDITRPSRREAELRFTDLRWFEELPRGGHFAALEQPASLVEQVRGFFRLVR
jgi:epoxide hydrolase